MSNIEVGEYIRTHKGIARVIPDGRYVEINEDEKKRMIYVDKNGIPCNWEFGYYVWSNKILKHSKNIIDLIEIGDFVNGNKVHSVDYSTSLQTGEKYLVIDKIYQSVKYFYEKDIKSIVTKEQFKEMEYRVDE